jgi:hypothetical protein
LDLNFENFEAIKDPREKLTPALKNVPEDPADLVEIPTDMPSQKSGVEVILKGRSGDLRSGKSVDTGLLENGDVTRPKTDLMKSEDDASTRRSEKPTYEENKTEKEVGIKRQNQDLRSGKSVDSGLLEDDEGSEPKSNLTDSKDDASTKVSEVPTHRRRPKYKTEKEVEDVSSKKNQEVPSVEESLRRRFRVFRRRRRY